MQGGGGNSDVQRQEAEKKQFDCNFTILSSK
jgi:hypothetical protein